MEVMWRDFAIYPTAWPSIAQFTYRALSRMFQNETQDISDRLSFGIARMQCFLVFAAIQKRMLQQVHISRHSCSISPS
jgi:hypothetical protein